jgi:hypothetical protein
MTMNGCAKSWNDIMDELIEDANKAREAAARWKAAAKEYKKLGSIVCYTTKETAFRMSRFGLKGRRVPK